MFASNLVFRQSVWCLVAFEANLWLCSSARRDSTSPTSMRNKETTWLHGIRETEKDNVRFATTYYAVRLTGIPRNQNNKAIW